MTLLITIVRVDEASGSVLESEVLDGPGGLAGFESTRFDLWSSPVVVALGARYLPRLRGESLWVECSSLGRFREELEMLLANVPAISRSTPYDEAFVASRLTNLINASEVAERRGAGLLVD